MSVFVAPPQPEYTCIYVETTSTGQCIAWRTIPNYVIYMYCLVTEAHGCDLYNCHPTAQWPGITLATVYCESSALITRLPIQQSHGKSCEELLQWITIMSKKLHQNAAKYFYFSSEDRMYSNAVRLSVCPSVSLSVTRWYYTCWCNILTRAS